MKSASLRNHPHCAYTSTRKLLVSCVRKATRTQSICRTNAATEDLAYGDSPFKSSFLFCLPDCALQAVADQNENMHQCRGAAAAEQCAAE